MKNLLRGIGLLPLFLVYPSKANSVDLPHDSLCAKKLDLASLSQNPELAIAVQALLDNVEVALDNVNGNNLTEKLKSVIPAARDLVPKRQVGFVNQVLLNPTDPNSWLVRLVEFEVGNEKKKLVELHFREGTTPVHPIRRQTLPLHHLTGAYFIKEKEEKAALENIVDSLARSMPQKPVSALLLLDINFLSKVNYFQEGGYKAGDSYIKAFGEAVKEVLFDQLRTSSTGSHIDSRKNHFPPDIVFTSGGDEFFIVLQGVFPGDVMNIVDRLQKEFQKNENVKKLFALQEKYIRGRLTQEVTEPSDEPQLTLEELEEFFKMTPSITVGGAMIREGKNFNTIFSEAESAYIRAKREFMQARGLDARKYGGRSSDRKLSNQSPGAPSFYLIQ